MRIPLSFDLASCKSFLLQKQSWMHGIKNNPSLFVMAHAMHIYLAFMNP